MKIVCNQGKIILLQKIAFVTFQTQSKDKNNNFYTQITNFPTRGGGWPMLFNAVINVRAVMLYFVLNSG